MNHYQATWTIDVFADTADAAARQAFNIVKNVNASIPDSATVWTVKDVQSDAETQIDLFN